MAGRKYIPHDTEKPTQVDGEEVWKGHFGEAQIRHGVPPPEARSLQADIWWLIDNVLKVGDCMDINRSYEQVKMQVARYNREREVPKGSIKARRLGLLKSRVWKIAGGYEKPDP